MLDIKNRIMLGVLESSKPATLNPTSYCKQDAIHVLSQSRAQVCHGSGILWNIWRGQLLDIKNRILIGVLESSKPMTLNPTSYRKQDAIHVLSQSRAQLCHGALVCVKQSDRCD